MGNDAVDIIGNIESYVEIYDCLNSQELFFSDSIIKQILFDGNVPNSKSVLWKTYLMVNFAVKQKK
jgi:hypothetical protein